MISEQPTRKIHKELKEAGWSFARAGRGSHSIWQCTTGQHKTVVPDGYRTITAGVVRTIRHAIDSCTCQEGQEQ